MVVRGSVLVAFLLLRIRTRRVSSTGRSHNSIIGEWHTSHSTKPGKVGHSTVTANGAKVLKNYALPEEAGVTVSIRLSSDAGYNISNETRATLLSSKGRSAVLYTFQDNGIKRVLKIPRNSETEEVMMDDVTGEVALSEALSSIGVPSPETRRVRVSLFDTHGQELSVRAVVKQLLIGFDLSDVIHSLCAEDVRFDRSCIEPQDKTRDAREHVMNMEGAKGWLEWLGFEQRGKRLGEIIQIALRCAVWTLAIEVLRNPWFFLADLKAENWMWACEVSDTFLNDDGTPTCYKHKHRLWLVDAILMPTSTENFMARPAVPGNSSAAMWTKVYHYRWDMAGPGQCDCKNWPAMHWPEDVEEATLFWQPKCFSDFLNGI